MEDYGRPSSVPDKRATLNRYKLDHGCADCGYAGHPAALDFDHRSPEKKERSSQGSALHVEWSWPRIMRQVKECDVVCANCHRVRTAKRGYRRRA